MIIVIIYVDDIIFGSDLQMLSENFASEMKKGFQMSMLGELKFFLGLQVSQSNKWIYISQTKYIKGMLKKQKMEDSKPISTPIIIGCKLSKDDESLEVDHTMYRSMIWILIYLMQVVGLVARFQSAPKETHVIAVKTILTYLKVL